MTPANRSAFLRSALHVFEDGWSPATTLEWLARQRAEVAVTVEPAPLEGLPGWSFEQGSGNLVHASGRFFSIVGVSVHTNWGPRAHWTQPIIHQPEVGYLGMIVRRVGGVLRFLVQAKVEPGNIGGVQISPTLQATRSNYTRVHGGRAPRYLEYFEDPARHRVLVDQLQSEQGARFLRKRNRNTIVEVDEPVPEHPDFCWLTLGQIKAMLAYDNVVNMDTRTVLGGIDYGRYGAHDFELLEILGRRSGINDRSRLMLRSAIERDLHRHSEDEILRWIAGLKSRYELDVQRIPLGSVGDWVQTRDEIHHRDRKYFSIIGARIRISNREVAEWHQPLVRPAQEGLIAFVVKELDGVYHFLVQAKVEAGNLDILEMAPTVQCITGNYRRGLHEYTVPFLDRVQDAPESRILYRALLSEEGGRFWHEQNLNLIVEAGPEFDDRELPPNYIWMTLRQLTEFTKFNNYLNIQARSLLAAARFLD